jgi:flagellar P-ring protein precursor FlgI
MEMNAMKHKIIKNYWVGWILCCAILAATVIPASAVRIKDIAAIKGVRSNQLLGYGLVVGLNGTGDKSGTAFTMQSLGNMIEHMGVHVNASSLKPKNIAAVMITAEMPAFSRIGSKMDIMVSSMGDAKSLVGGTLLMTPLRGVDGNVYALAQGAVAVGGAGGGGTTKNHLLVGRIAGGASIEKELANNFNDKEELLMSLFNPDFTTVSRIVKSINKKTKKKVAQAVDSGALRITVPDSMKGRVSEFIASIEGLPITPDNTAKVVVNEKTGTVIIGENVSISTVAVSHGNLTITIQNKKDVSQPAPLSGGETTVTNSRTAEMTEEEAHVMVLPRGTTIKDLVKALNAIGVTPRDLISIFQTIKASGALQAELEII